eukprot:gene6411-8825_t
MEMYSILTERQIYSRTSLQSTPNSQSYNFGARISRSNRKVEAATVNKESRSPIPEPINSGTKLNSVTGRQSYGFGARLDKASPAKVAASIDNTYKNQIEEKVSVSTTVEQLRVKNPESVLIESEVISYDRNSIIDVQTSDSQIDNNASNNNDIIDINDIKSFEIEIMDAEPVPIESEIVEPTIVIEVQKLSTEEVLKNKIEEEKSRRDKRKAEVTVLQNQLIKSMARKIEIESVIQSEMEDLRVNILEEIENEKKGLQQLEVLSFSFNEGLISKQDILAQESIVLEQMIEVRQKINETIILNQLDAAIAKKSELIDIERGVCVKVNECCDNIRAEIADAKEKLSSLINTLESLPSSDDKLALRSYSWVEVESLQAKLLDSLQTTLVRDEKVKAYVELFDTVLKQRGLILGTNNPTSSSTINSDSAPRQAMTTKELAEILKRQSSDEFTATSTEAIKKTGSSLFDATTSLFGVSAQVLTSEETAENKQKAANAVSRFSKVGEKFSSAVTIAQNIWKSEVTSKENEITNTNEYLNIAANGLQSVFKNVDIKNELSEGSKELLTSTSELVSVANNVAKTIGDQLKTSDKWNNAVANIADSFSMLFTIFQVGVKRASGEVRLERTLPYKSDDKK